MLEESLKAGFRESFIKEAELNRVNIDSTTQEKAVLHPTDAWLCDRMCERLVKSFRKTALNFGKLMHGSGKKFYTVRVLIRKRINGGGQGNQQSS